MDKRPYGSLRETLYHTAVKAGETFVNMQFKKLIGKGAFKKVYKAQDLEHGNLIAWNEVNIACYNAKERKRILNEVTLLRKLDHKNLIRFFGAWINKEKEQVVFVTELMSSGTLKECVCSMTIIYYVYRCLYTNHFVHNLFSLTTIETLLSQFVEGNVR